VPYTPEKTRLAEKKVGLAWDGPCYDGPVTVHLVFDYEGAAIIVEPMQLDEKSKLRGDIDNYVKTVMDGLHGKAWVDDKQVVKITAVKL
jgi:Holliday junction resolvase RusA-like endonuclease